MTLYYSLLDSDSEMKETEDIDGTVVSRIEWSSSDQQRLGKIQNMHRQSRLSIDEKPNVIAILPSTSASIQLIRCFPQSNNEDECINLTSTSSHSNQILLDHNSKSNINHYDNDNKNQIGNKGQKIPYHQIFSTLSTINFPENRRGVLWIKMNDLLCLPQINKRFHLHDEFITCFSDRKAQSSFLESSQGFFMSLCLFRSQTTNPTVGEELYESDMDIELSDFVMSKLYVYFTDQLVITYETDISICENPHNIRHNIWDCHNEPVGETVMKEISTDYSKYCIHGVGFLLSRLIRESLSLHKPLLEHCYRGISFYKQKLLALDGDMLEAASHLKVREIESCLLLLEKRLSEGLEVISQLCNKEEYRHMNNSYSNNHLDDKSLLGELSKRGYTIDQELKNSNDGSIGMDPNKNENCTKNKDHSTNHKNDSTNKRDHSTNSPITLQKIFTCYGQIDTRPFFLSTSRFF